ncbi:DNA polymerase III subunit gamma/tau, partial [bacterium]|nr:DNA polymerase III subunit gamma/tau [bacterium]
MEQNYLPLFRKYRPQSFKDIVGQENLVKALTNAIELGRIANAYLFSGPRGTGKTSTARIFAKSLNCEHGPTTEPCQKCPSCVDITNATGLDVIEIDAASNRGIQEAKELISQVQYAPINGKYKIYIIDEVHMLTNEAFNTLLKTFEEPPKNVIFILATTEPHKVLETIISRCQRFDLKRITVDDIVKRLREISDIENIKITDSALLTIAKNVSGGLCDSLALLDQVSILGVKEEIDKDLIEELLGKINFEILFNLLNLMVEKDVEKTLLEIDNIYAKGNEPKSLAENFIEFLKNVIMVLNSNDDK